MKTYKLINYPRITFFLALFSITLLMACSSKSLSPEMKKLNSQEELLSLNTKLNKLKIALEKEGLSVEVVDLRTVRPIDYATVIESVKKTNRLVVVEEAWPLASISTEIAYKVQREAFDYLDAPIQRVTMRDVPMSYAGNLVEATLPNAQRITAAIKKVAYLEA